MIVKYLIIFLLFLFVSCNPTNKGGCLFKSVDFGCVPEDECASNNSIKYAIEEYIKPSEIKVDAYSKNHVQFHFNGERHNSDHDVISDSIFFRDEDSNLVVIPGYSQRFDSLASIFGDTLFDEGDVAKKYKSGKIDICYHTYAGNSAITDTVTNISLVTLESFGEYSEIDTLNQNLDIEYSQWADFISSGYTLEAYNNANQKIPLDQFNQQKNILVDPRSVTLHFKSPLPTGNYSFQVRYSTTRGKVLTKDLDIVVE
jgi:hypothetical protein